MLNKLMSSEEKNNFKELLEIFSEFDTDGNGSISV
jgi:Ca2+-binding EF-hand superfamily protein